MDLKEQLPEAMKLKKNWVNYQKQMLNGKITKIPKQPLTLINASVVNENHWSDLDTAINSLDLDLCDGIGFVFDNDGICGIDLDNAIDENNVPYEWAGEIINKFSRLSYIELSPSKKGYHIITLGNLPKNVRHKSNDNITETGLIEIYDDKRYFTVTGDVYGDCNKLLDGQSEINWLLNKFNMLKNDDDFSSCINPKSVDLMGVSDEALLKNIRASPNKEKFDKLFNGDPSDYDNDMSRADMAFCFMLTSYTRDFKQIDNLYRMSNLYRPKWDGRRNNETYGSMTINQAFEYANTKNNKEFIVSKNFKRDNGILYYLVKKNEKIENIYVCKNFTIIGKVRDIESASWGLFIKWIDDDGKEHFDVVYRKELADNKYEWWRRLVDKGLVCDVTKNGKQYLLQYLNETEVDDRFVLVHKTGWIDNSYVMPGRVVNNDVDKQYLLVPSYKNEHFLEVRGELEKWKRLANYCYNNSRLITAMCAGFAAPLLSLANINNAGIHFFGSSSIGKSTAQIVANSIYRSSKGILTWRATDNGLENIASMRSDSLLVLDEISQVSEKVISQTVYMLGNGSGKIRSTKDSKLAEVKTWNIFVLSSGEYAISSMIEKAGGKINAGQEVRLIDIPAEADSDLGIFENIHNYDSPRNFADNLKSLADSNYGYAGEIYLEYVCKNYERIKEEIHKYIDQYVSSYHEINDSSQLQRIAKVFAILNYAGIIAIEANLLSMSKEKMAEGVNKCFQAFLSNRDNLSNSEDCSIVNYVCSAIEKNSLSKFKSLDELNDTRAIYDLMGYFAINNEGQREYYFTRNQFKDFAKGFNFNSFKDVLKSEGILITTESGDESHKRSLPGVSGRTRVFKIVIPH